MLYDKLRTTPARKPRRYRHRIVHHEPVAQAPAEPPAEAAIERQDDDERVAADRGYDAYDRTDYGYAVGLGYDEDTLDDLGLS